jgi:FdhE protein
MAQRILMPGELEKQVGDVPPVRLPERTALFADRAARLRSLAPGHSMEAYLLLIATIADAQHAILTAPPARFRIPPMDAAALERSRTNGMPPLAVASWVRDPGWRSMLAALLAHVGGTLADGPAAIAGRVAATDAAWIEAQATKIVNGHGVDLDRGAAIFIAAALQAYWTGLTLELGVDAFPALEVKSVCPCCGSRPVASIVRPGPQSGLRYLVCSLCAAEWHHVRITCANCGGNSKIEYFSVDGAEAKSRSAGDARAVRAESCDDCDTYLKIFNAERDPQVEPVADDLASLSLDLLMAERTHFLRSAVTLALFHGDDA